MAVGAVERSVVQGARATHARAMRQGALQSGKPLENEDVALLILQGSREGRLPYTAGQSVISIQRRRERAKQKEGRV